MPTIAEQGIADYALANWWAFFAPARTPPAIVEKLSADIRAALTHEATQKSFAAISATTLATPPDALKSLLAIEIERWKEIVRKAGIEPI